MTGIDNNMYWVHPDSIYTHHSYCEEGDTIHDAFCMVMFSDKDLGVEKKAWVEHLGNCEICSFVCESEAV